MPVDWQDYCYGDDCRVRAGQRAARRRFDAKRMVLTFAVAAIATDEDGSYESEDSEDVDLPAKYAVCPTCDGHGTHVNPSIDAGGITAGEMDDWGDEEREGYFDGRYDVTCYDCAGARVVPEIDEDRADKALLARVQRALDDDARFDAISAAERRMGA